MLKGVLETIFLLFTKMIYFLCAMKDILTAQKYMKSICLTVIKFILSGRVRHLAIDNDIAIAKIDI